MSNSLFLTPDVVTSEAYWSASVGRMPQQVGRVTLGVLEQIEDRASYGADRLMHSVSLTPFQAGTVLSTEVRMPAVRDGSVVLLDIERLSRIKGHSATQECPRPAMTRSVTDLETSADAASLFLFGSEMLDDNQLHVLPLRWRLCRPDLGVHYERMVRLAVFATTKKGTVDPIICEQWPPAGADHPIGGGEHPVGGSSKLTMWRDPVVGRTHIRTMGGRQPIERVRLRSAALVYQSSMEHRNRRDNSGSNHEILRSRRYVVVKSPLTT